MFCKDFPSFKQIMVAITVQLLVANSIANSLPNPPPAPVINTFFNRYSLNCCK